MSVFSFASIYNPSDKLDDTEKFNMFSPDVCVSSYKKNPALMMMMRSSGSGEIVQIGTSVQNPEPYTMYVDATLIEDNLEVASMLSAIGQVSGIVTQYDDNLKVKNPSFDGYLKIRIDPNDLARIDGEGLTQYEEAAGVDISDYEPVDYSTKNMSDLFASASHLDAVAAGNEDDSKSNDVAKHQFDFMDSYSNIGLANADTNGVNKTARMFLAYHDLACGMEPYEILKKEIMHQTGCQIYTEDGISDRTQEVNNRLLRQAYQNPDLAYRICKFVVSDSVSNDYSNDNVLFWMHGDDIVKQLQETAMTSAYYTKYGKVDDFDNKLKKYDKFVRFANENRVFNDKMENQSVSVAFKTNASTYLMTKTSDGKTKLYGSRFPNGVDIVAYGSVFDTSVHDIADENIGKIKPDSSVRLALEDGRHMTTTTVDDVINGTAIQTDSDAYVLSDEDDKTILYGGKYPDGVELLAYGSVYDESAAGIQSYLYDKNDASENTLDCYMRYYTIDGDRVTTDKVTDIISDIQIDSLSEAEKIQMFSKNSDAVKLVKTDGMAVELVNGQTNMLYLTDYSDNTISYSEVLSAGTSAGMSYHNFSSHKGDTWLGYTTLDGNEHAMDMYVTNVTNAFDSRYMNHVVSVQDGIVTSNFNEEYEESTDEFTNETEPIAVDVNEAFGNVNIPEIKVMKKPETLIDDSYEKKLREKVAKYRGEYLNDYTVPSYETSVNNFTQEEPTSKPYFGDTLLSDDNDVEHESDNVNTNVAIVKKDVELVAPVATVPVVDIETYKNRAKELNAKFGDVVDASEQAEQADESVFY